MFRTVVFSPRGLILKRKEKNGILKPPQYPFVCVFSGRAGAGSGLQLLLYTGHRALRQRLVLFLKSKLFGQLSALPAFSPWPICLGKYSRHLGAALWFAAAAGWPLLYSPELAPPRAALEDGWICLWLSLPAFGALKSNRPLLVCFSSGAEGAMAPAKISFLAAGLFFPWASLLILLQQPDFGSAALICVLGLFHGARNGDKMALCGLEPLRYGRAVFLSNSQPRLSSIPL